MTADNSSSAAGRVASLHLHPDEPGTPLRNVESVEVIAEKGILGNQRYFGRQGSLGKPGRRQVSLIEREQIAEHSALLGLESISPGAVRANIETLDIALVDHVGRQIEIGGARLLLCSARTPCEKMDAICPGLRAAMENGRQGVMAQVTQTGTIRVGDPIRIVAPIDD